MFGAPSPPKRPPAHTSQTARTAITSELKKQQDTVAVLEKEIATNRANARAFRATDRVKARAFLLSAKRQEEALASAQATIASLARQAAALDQKDLLSTVGNITRTTSAALKSNPIDTDKLAADNDELQELMCDLEDASSALFNGLTDDCRYDETDIDRELDELDGLGDLGELDATPDRNDGLQLPDVPNEAPRTPAPDRTSAGVDEFDALAL